MQVTYTEEEYWKLHYGPFTCADGDRRKASAAWKEREEKRKKLREDYEKANAWINSFQKTV